MSQKVYSISFMATKNIRPLDFNKIYSKSQENGDLFSNLERIDAKTHVRNILTKSVRLMYSMKGYRTKGSFRFNSKKRKNMCKVRNPINW